MKTLSALTLIAVSAAAQPVVYNQVSNPPPQIVLAWDAAPGVTAWNYYYGTASRAYTNKTAVTTNQVPITLPARGVKFFFAATAVQNGLESQFSNEANYTASNAPPAPNLQAPVVLTVQYKNDLQDFMWADSGMAWPIYPEQQTNQFFRLNIVMNPVATAPQAPARLPPMPR